MILICSLVLKWFFEKKHSKISEPKSEDLELKLKLIIASHGCIAMLTGKLDLILVYCDYDIGQGIVS